MPRDPPTSKRAHQKQLRTEQARRIIDTQIPAVLESNERAANGVASARLLRGDTDLPSIATAQQRPIINQEGKPEAADATPRSSLPVRIIAGDTLDVAYAAQLAHPNARVAVLNMASPLQPGGGVLRGAMAQEESLCLRSTLYPSLQQEWYPLPEDGVAWTQDVLVFGKLQAADKVQTLESDEMWYVNIVSCAAVRLPELRRSRNGEQYADPHDEEVMAAKIRYIMRACVKMGVQVVILGALGCGAYRNPVAKVARMMRKCLLWHGDGPQEDWAAAGIKEVRFAILDETSERKVWNGFVKEFRRLDGVSIHG